MAAIAATSAAVAPASLQVATSSKATSSQTVVKAFTGLKNGALFAGKNEFSSKTVSNGSRVSCMKVWNPIDNIKFETLSYLPPLTNDAIAREIDYMLRNNWIPCIEFDAQGVVYRENNAGPGYYDGRYWTMWKLPLFGCTDPSAVLRELDEAKRTYPGCYIRVLGFDNIRQVQCMSFIAYKPAY